MKKLNILGILLIISSIKLFSHDNETVHQRIVLEAYELLKLQLSKEENGFADNDNEMI